MKNLNEITEIMEAIRMASLLIEPEDVAYVSEMIRTTAKFDKTYATAYEKMHNIFMYVALDETVPAEYLKPIEPETKDKIDKMAEEAKESIHQELEDFRETLLNDSVEEIDEAAETLINHAVEKQIIENDKILKQQQEQTETDKTEPPIIFQHPDYPTIGAGTDGQVYGLKDGKWKKADTRSVYFPKKKDGTWGRVEREEILDLLNNYNTSAWNEPQSEPSAEKTVEEYDALPEGYFIHPKLSYLAANEDGTILKYNKESKKWKLAEVNVDSRGCRKVKGIGTAKCVYECINRRIVTGHVRHLNGDSWDDRFTNLSIYGDKNWHKFSARTYDDADIHEICEYICKHNGDVSNISRDTKGRYSIYYARKILCKAIHDNISDKYFRYTSGGALYIHKEGEVK